MEYTWSSCNDLSSLEELLLLIEPDTIERTAIQRCLKETNIYNAYIAKSPTGEIDALCISTFLQKTQTLHVEDFALHPRIRGKHLAQSLWDAWWHHLEKEKVIREEQPMTIEVYPKNVIPWTKIMKVHVLFESALLWTRESIVWMGKNLPEGMEASIVQEWRNLQEKEQLRQRGLLAS